MILLFFFRPVPKVMPKIYEPKIADTKMMDTADRPENDGVLKTQNNDDQRRKPTFLFSIDYILNKAGETSRTEDDETDKQNSQHYDWLYCTRFKPPKLDSKYMAFWGIKFGH